jgi:hypothetical protein
MNVVLKRSITGGILGAFFWISFIHLSSTFFSLVLVAILIQVLLFEWKNFFSLYRPAYWIMMPFYPILPFMLLIAMNHSSEYRTLLLILRPILLVI